MEDPLFIRSLNSSHAKVRLNILRGFHYDFEQTGERFVYLGKRVDLGMLFSLRC